MNRCPNCGRYVTRVTCLMNPNGDVSNVTGYCTHCRRRVEVHDWIWEQFEPAYERMEAEACGKTL